MGNRTQIRIFSPGYPTEPFKMSSPHSCWFNQVNQINRVKSSPLEAKNGVLVRLASRVSGVSVSPAIWEKVQSGRFFPKVQCSYCWHGLVRLQYQYKELGLEDGPGSSSVFFVFSNYLFGCTHQFFQAFSCVHMA